MTQRDKLLEALARADSAAVMRTLDEAQNAPPLGTADGSISAHEWTATWELEHRRKQYLQARARFILAWRMKTWLNR
jgi:hypothetical protein